MDMKNKVDTSRRNIPRKRDLRITPKAGVTLKRRRLENGGKYE